MVSLTLAVPRELKVEMDKHPDVNWSEVARQSIQQKLKDQEALAFFRRIAVKSKLTEADAIELGREVNKRVAKHYL